MAFNAKCKELFIYVRSKNWPWEEKKRCEYELGRLLEKTWEGTRRLTVDCFEDDADPKYKQHPRYIFSEKGGVQIDRGLQVVKAIVHFSMLEKHTHDDLMKFYWERPLALAVHYRVSFLA